jgi:cell division septal protein FtsQ
LAYKSIENVRYKPMVFIDKELVKKSLLSHQPNIKDISIRKIYPSNLKITLSSYKDLYNIKLSNKYYKITEN